MGDDGKKTLFNLIVNMLALMLVPYLVSGVYIGNIGSAFAAALLLMILNKLVKPILEIISLPLTCMTLGLFELVISAFILKLVDMLLSSVYFASAGRYFAAVVIIAIVNGLFGTGKD